MNKPELIGDPTRCLWCGKKVGAERLDADLTFRQKEYVATFCSQQHVQCALQTYRRIEKLFPLFFIGLFSGLLLLVGNSVFDNGHWYLIAGVAVLGTTIMLCPCATPQTVELMGLKRSIAVVRIFGAGYVLVALILLFRKVF